jgi:hypothetical protein
LLLILVLYARVLRASLRAADGARLRAAGTALAWAGAALAFFLLPTQVHERYALYLLPPLLLAALWRPAGRGARLGLVWGVSGLVLLNLYYITPLLPWDRATQQFVGDVLGRGAAVIFLATGLGCGWWLARSGRNAINP